MIGFEGILQDVVRRSALDHIEVETAWTCTKMRPDGFGGAACLITADDVRSMSTGELLAESNEALTPDVAPDCPFSSSIMSFESPAAAPGFRFFRRRNMSAKLIYDSAPLGSIIRFSNAVPRPPERFRRKVAAWENDKGSGRLVECHPPYAAGSNRAPASFTLETGSYYSGAR